MNLRATIYRIVFPLAKLIWRIFKLKSSGAGCIIKNGNKILMIKHTYGKPLWSFPGGGLKRNEDPERAAIREVHEEVGIHLESVKALGSFSSKINESDTVYVFYAETKNEDIKKDPGEILEAKWFDLDNLPTDELSYVGREMLRFFREPIPESL